MSEQEEPKTGSEELIESEPVLEDAVLEDVDPEDAVVREPGVEAAGSGAAEIASEVLEMPGEAVPEPEMSAEPGQVPRAQTVEAELVEPEAEELGELQGFEGEPALPEAEGTAMPEPEPEKVEVDRGLPLGPEPPLVEVMPAPVGWGRFLFTGLLSAILGALLALAFLFAVNGTLDFQGAAARAVDSEVAQLQGQIDSLNARLEQTQNQVQALQGLSPQIDQARADIRQVSADLAAMQEQARAMSAALETTQQELTNLTENVDGMTGQVSSLTDRLVQAEKQMVTLDEALQAIRGTTLRFEAFLDGLRELLGEPSGSLHPTAAPGITPIPSATSIPRPKVTVIPLATPTPTP